MKSHILLVICAYSLLLFNVSSALAVPAVARYDGVTGEFLGLFAKSDLLVFPVVPTFGPDGNLYVPNHSGSRDGNVLRFDGGTGAFIDVFAEHPAIVEPPSAVFGSDKNLYVLNNIGGEVTRFDGTSGGFIDVFAGGGFFRATQHLFGPDGNIYIGETGVSSTEPGLGVYRYDGDTGDFIDIFTSGGPRPGIGGLTFGPDGNLYVADRETDSILRYDGLSGVFMDVFASVGPEPFYPTFGPDGNLYVNEGSTGELLQYDGLTGDFVDVFVSSDQLDPSRTFGAAIFGPDGDLYRSGTYIPLPAAVWLFASGLLGLIGIARRKAS